MISNIALCHFNLSLYEDAIECCNQALSIDSNHLKSLLIKAKSLALLHSFDLSIAIFRKINFQNEIKFVNQLEA